MSARVPLSQTLAGSLTGRTFRGGAGAPNGRRSLSPKLPATPTAPVQTGSPHAGGARSPTQNPDVRLLDPARVAQEQVAQASISAKAALGLQGRFPQSRYSPPQTPELARAGSPGGSSDQARHMGSKEDLQLHVQRYFSDTSAGRAGTAASLGSVMETQGTGTPGGSGSGVGQQQSYTSAISRNESLSSVGQQSGPTELQKELKELRSTLELKHAQHQKIGTQAQTKLIERRPSASPDKSKKKVSMNVEQVEQMASLALERSVRDLIETVTKQQIEQEKINIKLINDVDMLQKIIQAEDQRNYLEKHEKDRNLTGVYSDLDMAMEEIRNLKQDLAHCGKAGIDAEIGKLRLELNSRISQQEVQATSWQNDVFEKMHSIAVHSPNAKAENSSAPADADFVTRQFHELKTTSFDHGTLINRVDSQVKRIEIEMQEQEVMITTKVENTLGDIRDSVQTQRQEIANALQRTEEQILARLENRIAEVHSTLQQQQRDAMLTVQKVQQDLDGRQRNLDDGGQNHGTKNQSATMVQLQEDMNLLRELLESSFNNRKGDDGFQEELREVVTAMREELQVLRRKHEEQSMELSALTAARAAADANVADSRVMRQTIDQQLQQHAKALSDEVKEQKAQLSILASASKTAAAEFENANKSIQHTLDQQLAQHSQMQALSQELKDQKAELSILASASQAAAAAREADTQTIQNKLDQQLAQHSQALQEELLSHQAELSALGSAAKAVADRGDTDVRAVQQAMMHHTQDLQQQIKEQKAELRAELNELVASKAAAEQRAAEAMAVRSTIDEQLQQHAKAMQEQLKAQQKELSALSDACRENAEEREADNVALQQTVDTVVQQHAQVLQEQINQQRAELSAISAATADARADDYTTLRQAMDQQLKHAKGLQEQLNEHKAELNALGCSAAAREADAAAREADALAMQQMVDKQTQKHSEALLSQLREHKIELSTVCAASQSDAEARDADLALLRQTIEEQLEQQGKALLQQQQAVQDQLKEQKAQLNALGSTSKACADVLEQDALNMRQAFDQQFQQHAKAIKSLNTAMLDLTVKLPARTGSSETPRSTTRDNTGGEDMAALKTEIEALKLQSSLQRSVLATEAAKEAAVLQKVVGNERDARVQEGTEMRALIKSLQAQLNQAMNKSENIDPASTTKGAGYPDEIRDTVSGGPAEPNNAARKIIPKHAMRGATALPETTPRGALDLTHGSGV